MTAPDRRQFLRSAAAGVVAPAAFAADPPAGKSMALAPAPLRFDATSLPSATPRSTTS